MKIRPGFVVYENGNKEVTWVTPHSGPALETPTSRDDNSDTVASLCWLKVGGKFIVSTIPRKRALGIDFNRNPPPPKKSLDYFRWFMNDENPGKLEEYREQYAWTAADRRDHARRLKAYKDFWSEVGSAGHTVVYMHTKFTRIKNYPSIMDIIAYEDYGFSRKLLVPIVRRINRKYADFFYSIADNYKNNVYLQQKRILERISEIYGGLDTKNIKAEYLTHLKNDLKVIRKYAEQKYLKKLETHFTEKNFMLAVKSALKNAGSPRVTIESIFKGRHARTQAKRIYRRKNVIAIELNGFLGHWYPNEASEIILELVNAIKPMRKITEYLSEDF